MSKRITLFEFMLPPRDPSTSMGRWLYQALRTEILEGRLRPGTRLPATRDLASQYQLSRGTIVSAFEELKAEGYLEGTVGSGTYVSKVLPDDLLHVSRKAAKKEATQKRPKRRFSDYAKRMQAVPNFEARPTRAFRPNLPALDEFPISLWAQITARRLRRLSTNNLLVCGTLGYLPLREAIASYLSASRGVNCTPAQVVIVSGVQEAIDLVGRLFLNAGDCVVVENPGYRGAPRAFEALGARVSPVDVDHEGLRVEDAGMKGAKLAYVTPGHQFPLGVTMSLSRRLALLEWARITGALIFEDDYDSEYRYTGRPIPALQGLDRSGQVIFTGSFSKVLFPSLRMGYLVIPEDLIEVFEAAMSLANRHNPLMQQTVVCDFIAEGHFGRHLRRMREIYADRLGTLMECAERQLAGLLDIPHIEAGLQTTGFLGGGISERSATQAAEERGVEVVPLSGYMRSKPKRAGLQLGFAAIPPREIKRGVENLAIALESVRRYRNT